MPSTRRVSCIALVLAIGLTEACSSPLADNRDVQITFRNESNLVVNLLGPLEGASMDNQLLPGESRVGVTFADRFSVGGDIGFRATGPDGLLSLIACAFGPVNAGPGIVIFRITPASDVAFLECTGSLFQ